MHIFLEAMSITVTGEVANFTIEEVGEIITVDYKAMHKCRSEYWY